MRYFKSPRKFLALGLLITLTFSLSGCGLIPLPKEQRYKNIDLLWNELDIGSLGTIVSDEYGGGDGTFGQSYRDTTILGDNVSSILKERLSKDESAKCNFGNLPMTCELNYGVITIDFFEELVPSGTAMTVRIMDNFNGKRQITK